MTARYLFQDAAPQDAPTRKAGEMAELAPAAAAASCGTCGNAGVPNNGLVTCKHLPKWTRGTLHAPCYFTPPKWIPMDETALAKRAAQQGIDQAVAAAERAVPEWSDIALQFVRLFATRNRGKQYIGHDIVQASIAAGIIQPPNQKAWGGPIQRASRAGYIRKIGTAEDPNRHANPVPLWGSGEREVLEAA